jgi:hypothetical protein
MIFLLASKKFLLTTAKIGGIIWVKVEGRDMETLQTAIEICGLGRTVIYILLVIAFYLSVLLTLTLIAKNVLTNRK